MDRYFVLSDLGLQYYRKKGDPKPRFEATPKDILDAFYSDKQKDPSVVTIVTRKKNLQVKIISPIGKHNWIRLLKQLRTPRFRDTITKKNYVDVDVFM